MASARPLVALLRAVNVGGTGVLAMRDLARLCTEAGFAHVRTWIQSGNVVFETSLTPARAASILEETLAAHMGAAVGVVIRTGEEMREVLEANPFPHAAASRVVVFFGSEVWPGDAMRAPRGPDGEQVVARHRELFVHYPIGQGRSKLKLPKAPGVVTARNLNTVAKLVALAGVTR